MRNVFVYSLDTSKESQITDGTSDARYPVFDKNGKSIYFAASTDLGLSIGWLDLSSFQHPVSRSIYAVVLKKGDPSPVEPQSDEEKAASDEKSKDADKDKAKEADKSAEKGKESEKKEGEKKDEVKVTFDLDGIGQRIVAMPIKAANYIGLDVGKTGVLFLSEIPDVPSLTEPTLVSVSKFDLSTRKTEPFLGGVSSFLVSANGEKVLYRQGREMGLSSLMGWRSTPIRASSGIRCTTKSGGSSATSCMTRTITD
jgi:tricorn protease